MWPAILAPSPSMVKMLAPIIVTTASATASQSPIFLPEGSMAPFWEKGPWENVPTKKGPAGAGPTLVEAAGLEPASEAPFGGRLRA